MSKVIGLTGGIASGKSTVSELLSAHGFKIVDADIASRQAVEKGTKGLERVKEAFGEQAIDENGEMNRAYVGEVVFNQPEKRLELNEIVHPIVRNIMEQEKEAFLKTLGDNKDKKIVIYCGFVACERSNVGAVLAKKLDIKMSIDFRAELPHG